METSPNKITLSLDGSAEVSVKGFIAPIEYTQYNFHVKWDALANLRVAAPEKQYATSSELSVLESQCFSFGRKNLPCELDHGVSVVN